MCLVFYKNGIFFGIGMLELNKRLKGGLDGGMCSAKGGMIELYECETSGQSFLSCLKNIPYFSSSNLSLCPVTRLISNR
jgi:hypothetical protein